MKGSTVLIVGSGISGLMTARALTSAGMTVLVVDKAKGVGGRMATRRLTEGACDHGAQFFTVRSAAFGEIVSAARDAGAAVEWSRGFTRGDGDGPAEDGHPRFRGAPSMNALPKMLARDLRVRLETEILSLRIERGLWHAVTESQEVIEAEHVFLSAPVPQSLALLDAGGVALPPSEASRLRACSYHPCLALMLRLDGPSSVPAPGGVYPFGDDTGEPVSWIADNALKGVSPAATTLTVHAGSRWSAERFAADEEEVTRELTGLVRPWLGGARVLESRLHRWRYSRPVRPLEEPFLRSAATPPLYFIGDAFGGAKIEGAALSGLTAARDLLDRRA